MNTNVHQTPEKYCRYNDFALGLALANQINMWIWRSDQILSRPNKKMIPKLGGFPCGIWDWRPTVVQSSELGLNHGTCHGFISGSTVFGHSIHLVLEVKSSILGISCWLAVPLLGEVQDNPGHVVTIKNAFFCRPGMFLLA